jgi:putative addiction module component (TIGR02574 family)
MSALMEQVEREALSLPGEERARLAEKLWESLDDSGAPLSEAWVEEIERRRQEVRAGSAKPVPGAEVSRKAWELAKKAGA